MGEGAGKSGSFFFKSHDGLYIIKTMRGGELNAILDMSPYYINHLEQNPDSLLCKIFGVFTIKMAGLAPVNVLLMENTMQLGREERLLKVFDLKGSTF